MVGLLELSDVVRSRKQGRPFRWEGPVADTIEEMGLDVYREICCALGQDARLGGYIDQVRETGSVVETTFSGRSIAA